jgi:hypothetical protein
LTLLLFLIHTPFVLCDKVRLRIRAADKAVVTTVFGYKPAEANIVNESDSPPMPYSFFLWTYMGLWTLFLLLTHWLGFAWPDRVNGIDFLLLCLATFRLTEVVTEEKVARCLRAPFCELKTTAGPDGSEVQEEVPMGRGVRRVAGELLLCPWCMGIWIATLLTFFWIAVPGLARLVMIAFGAAAGGLLFQILAKLIDHTRKSLPD